MHSEGNDNIQQDETYTELISAEALSDWGNWFVFDGDDEWMKFQNTHHEMDLHHIGGKSLSNHHCQSIAIELDADSSSQMTTKEISSSDLSRANYDSDNHTEAKSSADLSTPSLERWSCQWPSVATVSALDGIPVRSPAEKEVDREAQQWSSGPMSVNSNPSQFNPELSQFNPNPSQFMPYDGMQCRVVPDWPSHKLPTSVPSSKSETSNKEKMTQVLEEDVCFVCGDPILRVLKTTTAVEVWGPDGNTSLEQKVLILCDGCDGTFHPQCVGLARIPKSDWYCQTCLLEKESAKVVQIKSKVAVVRRTPQSEESSVAFCSYDELELRIRRSSSDEERMEEDEEEDEEEREVQRMLCVFCFKSCRDLEGLQFHLANGCPRE